MLISASDEDDLLTQQPLKASNGIGSDGGVSAAQMRRGIHVIKRSGKDKRVTDGGFVVEGSSRGTRAKRWSTGSSS